ncbi:ATPase family, AAA domain containing 5b [Silurus meridionalis]|nr:ATPase family, AAA domain containing 5b [Silurus meridionalis]
MASSCIPQSFTPDNKHVKGENIQIQKSSLLEYEKPKYNRLKRVKRSRRSDLMLPECEGIRHDVTDEHHHDCNRSSDTSIMKTPRPLTTPGAQCSPPTRGLLFHMNKSGGQKLVIKSEPNTLCHQEPPIPEEEAGGLKGLRDVRDLHKHEEEQKELLREVCTHGESVHSSLFVSKRKQEVQSHSDEHLCKRQRWSQDRTEMVNTSEGHVTSGEGAIKRNRLRRKQQRVKNVNQEERRVRQDEDLPWTEKYRPRGCEEMVGNSAAVKKLYSWLKKWRIRADVEERRRRREEQRMKKESNGSWDCGDFEGDLQMEECDGELCNTLLIHGPTGTGKSAAVFACAEQLGFNVLEVNSSSLRSGRLVLSQLKESTQSHQVGAPQPSISHTPSPAAASRQGASQEPIWSCRKPSAMSRAASRRKCGVSRKSVTLTRYFRKTGNKHTELPHDTRPPDDVTRDESKCKQDGVPDKNDKTPPISLVLFEEVDIVFEEDVGFFAAIKTLMSTTKRPIILTTNDPASRKSFDGRFEEIRFRTPAQCRSYNELHRCIEILVESWRKGRSLLYSNLDILLAQPTFKNAHQSAFDQKNKAQFPPSSRKLKVQRNVLRKQHSIPALPLDGAEHMNQSATGFFSKVDSLACFFDTMSFVDSYLCWGACRKLGPLGAKMVDGLLDEPGEDVEMRTHISERCYEILAVVEGLAFHKCRTEVCPMKRGNQSKAWKRVQRFGFNLSIYTRGP